MHVSGKVNRAFSVNGIPSGRVGTAEKLNLQADESGGFFDWAANDFLGRLPGGTTGCTPFDCHGFNFTFSYLDLELRGTKPFTIFTQTILPGKSASGGRGGHALDFHFLARGYHWNALLPAQMGKIQ